MNSLKKTLSVSLTVLLIGISSCAGLHFSQTAYNTDQQIKTAALQLLAHSGESYKLHEAAADSLQTSLAAAVESEKSRGKTNIATIKMWQEVQSGTGNLGTLLTIWKTQDSLSKPMVPESTKQVERLLNSISDLENYKIK